MIDKNLDLASQSERRRHHIDLHVYLILFTAQTLMKEQVSKLMTDQGVPKVDMPETRSATNVGLEK